MPNSSSCVLPHAPPPAPVPHINYPSLFLLSQQGLLAQKNAWLPPPASPSLSEKNDSSPARLARRHHPLQHPHHRYRHHCRKGHALFCPSGARAVASRLQHVREMLVRVSAPPHPPSNRVRLNTTVWSDPLSRPPLLHSDDTKLNVHLVCHTHDDVGTHPPPPPSFPCWYRCLWPTSCRLPADVNTISLACLPTFPPARSRHRPCTRNHHRLAQDDRPILFGKQQQHPGKRGGWEGRREGGREGGRGQVRPQQVLALDFSSLEDISLEKHQLHSLTHVFP